MRTSTPAQSAAATTATHVFATPTVREIPRPAEPVAAPGTW